MVGSGGARGWLQRGKVFADNHAAAAAWTWQAGIGVDWPKSANL